MAEHGAHGGSDLPAKVNKEEPLIVKAARMLTEGGGEIVGSALQPITEGLVAGIEDLSKIGTEPEPGKLISGGGGSKGHASTGGVKH